MGEPAGISRIEHGIRDVVASGSRLIMPFLLALEAEALHLADRTFEALNAIRKAEALVERSEQGDMSADCTGSAVCFSRLWVLTRPKLRLRSAQPLAPQRSRNRFHWRHARRQAMPHTAAEERNSETRLSQSLSNWMKATDSA